MATVPNVPALGFGTVGHFKQGVEMSGKNASSTRGRPFAKGNTGRPKGSRNKVTVAVETLLDGDAERLTRKAIELAMEGDTTALRLCLERIAPPRKDSPTRFLLPHIDKPTDTPKAVHSVLKAVSEGELTPHEAQSISNIVETWRRSIETAELVERIEVLENVNETTKEAS